MYPGYTYVVFLYGLPYHKPEEGYSLSCEVPDQSSLTGYIMVEQIKSVDFVSRKVKFVGHAPQAVLNEVLAILDACLYHGA